MKLLRRHEVEVAVARALEEWSPNDIARGEALAIYLAARIPGRPGEDDRLAVPDFIANFADAPEPQQEGRDRYEEALRYIAGEDVGGFDAHMRPQDVARAALNPEGQEGLGEPTASLTEQQHKESLQELERRESRERRGLPMSEVRTSVGEGS